MPVAYDRRMRVLLVSYFAPLADHQAGGVQQWVRHILPRLVSRGMRFTVLCPAAAPGPLLDLGPDLQVLPELYEPGRGPLRADEARHNLETLARHAAGADVIWVLDRHLPIRLPQPVVLSWTTVAYWTEVEGLLGCNWDVAVVPSPYMVRQAAALVGPAHGGGGRPPVVCIPCPVDVDRFRPVDPPPVVEAAGGHPFLLFPHRPDADKGFDVALGVLGALAGAGAPHRLLVPLPPASVRAVRGRERRLVQRFQRRAAAVGLGDRVVFYPWAPASAMPGLYSAAEWTLVLSRLPESFVLTAAESLACGTPVLATPAGALPDLVPPGHGLVLLDGFRDVDAIAAHVLAGRPPLEEIRRGARHVADAYGADRIADAYVTLLRTARKRPSEPVPRAGDDVALSPWCRQLDRSTLWHDYQMRAIRLSRAEADRVASLRGGGATAGRDAVTRRLLDAGVLLLTDAG
jgi:glycosyltransferase involved in cell wall biosynthesis